MNPLVAKILTSLAMWGIKKAFDYLQNRYDSLTIEQKAEMKKRFDGMKIPEDWASAPRNEP